MAKQTMAKQTMAKQTMAKKLTRQTNRKLNRKRLKGGSSVAANAAPVKDCNVAPDLRQYIAPCNVGLPLDKTFSAAGNSIVGNQAGGSCAMSSSGTTVPCNQSVDVSRYTEPCPKGLPLDGAFQEVNVKVGGGGFYPDVTVDKIGGLPEIKAYDNCNSQCGGAAFTKIKNPTTGRMVSIYGKTGKSILKRYLKMLKK